MTNPLRSSLIADIRKTLFEGPARTTLPLRQSIRQKIKQEVRTGTSTALKNPALNSYLEKLSRHAYQITDEDLQQLAAAGHSEDEVFEATLAAAFEAGTSRRDIVLELLKGGA